METIEVKKARVLIDKYIQYSKFLDEEVILNEDKFSFKVKNEKGNSMHCNIRGKADKILRLKNRKVYVMEHKTCSGFPSLEELRLKNQGDIYLEAYKEYEPDGLIWDYVKKPTIRQRKNETEDEYIERLGNDIDERPDYYFFNMLSRRWETEKARTMQDVKETIKMIRAARKADTFPRNTSQCKVFYSCDYIDICAGITDREEIIENEFEVYPRKNSNSLNVSFSALDTFKTCPRKYCLRYIEGLKKIKVSDALYFGRMFHEALEIVYEYDGMDRQFKLDEYFTHCTEQVERNGAILDDPPTF